MPNLTMEKKQAIAEEARKELSRNHLLDFTTYTKPDYETNWHHETLCSFLERFANGDIKKAMVFMPPQHGKSEIVSRRLPAYIFGKNPDAKVVAASYAAELAQGMNRDVQRIIDSPEYHALFPDTRLNNDNVRTKAGNYLRNNDIFEIVQRRGQYRCAGVGGGLTGFPADFAIIDDPFKDYKEALSPTVRKAVWEWYTSVLLSRTHEFSRVLITLTRWHEDDLAARLLDKDDSGEWEILKLPAICEDETPAYEKRKKGEALWKKKFPKKLLLDRKKLNPNQFEALYQQNPRPKEGNMFNRSDMEVVDAVPAHADARVRRWDMAATKDDGDYTAGVLMSRVGDIYYIEDVRRFQYSSAERDKEILNTAQRDSGRYKNTVKVIGPQDPGSAGKDAAEAFKKLLAGFPVETEQESGTKEMRADPLASQVGAGNVKVLKADWNNEFFEELETFPNGAHDDMLDAASGAFSKLTFERNQTHAGVWGRR